MAPVRGQGSGVRGQSRSGASPHAEPLTPDPRPLAPLPLWLWPLLGALLLAPLRAAQFDRVPVAAVNALVAAAVILKALRPRPVASEKDPGRSALFGAARGRDPVTLCLGAFLGLNLLSLVVSIYVHGTLTALLDLAALFGAYLLLAHGGSSRRAVDWALGALLLARESPKASATADKMRRGARNQGPIRKDGGSERRGRQ